MTDEFDIEQDRDPELVEDELTDEQDEVEIDLPEYDESLFAELPEDFDDEDEDEEEDGELE